MKTLLERIHENFETMGSTDKKISEYILANTEEVPRISIVTLGKKLHIANSTIYKYAKRLGYSGFPDLKVALLTEQIDSNPFLYGEITPNLSTSTIIKRIFNANIHSIQETEKTLDANILDTVADLMVSANKILFIGIGGSASITLDTYQTFLRAPLNCIYVPDLHMQLMNASILENNDIAFIISHTGTNRDIIHVARVAKEAGAKVIVLTTYPASPITKYADYILISNLTEQKNKPESISVRLSQLAIIDTLFVLVQIRDEGRTIERLKKTRSSVAHTRTTLKYTDLPEDNI